MHALKAVRSTFAIAATLMLSAHAAAAQALPTAAEVIAKHVAAIGGKDAVKGIKSMKQIGTMEITAAGMTADVEMTMVAPNKQAMKLNLAGLGEIQQGTDGTVAWSVDPMRGPRLLDGKELDQAREQADFVAGMLYEADRYSAMTNEGIVDFAGEKAYKIKMVRKGSGTESWQYFSVATGLQIGSESTVTTEMGTTSSSTTVGGYQQFGPIKLPTRSEMMAGPQKMVMTTKTVEFNTAGPDAVTAPAAVQPLIKK